MTAVQRSSAFDIVRTKPQRAPKPVDIGGLRVESGVPYPIHRVHLGGKYEALFESMKLGDSIPCEHTTREHLCNAMRKWIERQGKSAHWCVRSIKRDDSGRARVWLLQK
jgi:hypothetical protein